MILLSDIQDAWETFQATGSCDESLVAPQILRSWQRSHASGVGQKIAMSLPAAPQPLDPRRDALVVLARPSMEDLYQFVEGSGFAVLVFDATLTLIEWLGDAPMIDAIESLRLGLGVSWREEAIGTIAVNLALGEALPWQTRGFEHYRSAYHHLACSAAPLFDIGGQAMGVIGVLGYADAAHLHTLGMVITAAQAIHAQVRNNVLQAETNNHLAELNAVIETISEGILFLDPRGCVSKMNSRAGQMLGLSPRSAAGRPIDDLILLPSALRSALLDRRELVDQELLFDGRKGAVAVLCSVRPVADRGRHYLGALITLRPPESVHRLVQRVVGAQARFTFFDIAGESPAIQAAIRHARIAANSQAPVLLEGEHGAGKELFAHAIHSGGPRSGGPFVVLNCAAVPRALLLGELLGYEGERAAERTESRPGKLELAQGGTLLIEEVSALPVEAQTSLLRAIETQNLIRTGGRRVVPLDVRLITTTRRDLQHDVASGRFRPELFYRLSVLTISIPPLRERGDDVLLLINQLLASMNRRMGKQTLLAPDALAALLAYQWPGNVRELEATLERLLHLTEKSVLTLADLPDSIAHALPVHAPAPAVRLHDRYAIAEREAILRAGRDTGGHLGRAAERLGISRATLWRKMKLYNLSREQFWTPK